MFFKLLTHWSVAALTLLTLSHCSSSMLGTSPQVIGVFLTEHEKKKVDRELDSVYGMRDMITSTAYKFQTQASDQPAVLKKAKAKYELAKADLSVLRKHVVRRTEVGKSYVIPESAEKNFQKSGNDFLNYYRTVNDNTKFGSALLVGIGLVYNWNDMLISKQAAVIQHVESQLQLDDWKNIKL